VHKVMPVDELATAGEEMLRAVLQGAPGARADAKDLVFLCEGRPVDVAFGGETGRRIALRRASAEGQEGISAFFDKPPPAWRHED